jgi:hypothetical protein
MMPALSLQEALERLSRDWHYSDPGRRWKLYGFLFCRPDLPSVGESILKSIDYYHHRSGEHIDFFFPGFTERWHKSEAMAFEVKGPEGQKWWYSPKDFNEWRKDLEQLSDWVYSGMNELLLVNIGVGRYHNNPFVDFDNAIAIRLDEIKDGDTISALFERIFKYSEDQDEENPIWAFSDSEGRRLAKNAFRDALIAYLPSSIQKHFSEGFKYTVKSLTSRDERRQFLQERHGTPVRY